MGATLSVTQLVWVPLAPLLGALVAGVLGTQLGGNWLGRRTVHTLTIGAVALACALSLLTLWQVITQGASFNGTLYEWMVVGGLRMEIGFMVDGLTALMMCVVTFVSLMVHVYTIGYMADDPGYNRFFSYLSLFTFAMLMLVMSNNLLQLFFGWEAVGLVSYLLIGFWYTRPTAVFANLKAFLVNRVGDFGFILGIGVLVGYGGTLNYTELFGAGPALAQQTLPGTDWLVITVACIGLFVGAMGKSAQFPLHVWLPDSMEGPTPISALIHAATMVTAGIFMVARMSPLFELSDTALNLILVVGAITALFMGLLGVVQNDIKRVVAYSTLSQLGYMTVALGASAYSVAVFHLATHAFFKALLFLAAGSVIMGLHHNQDMRYMGGVRKYMPITYVTSLIGTLALVGTPFFSGFYSKDSIIEAVHLSNLSAAGWAYAAVVAGVFITAFYSFRLLFLVFHGTERYDQVPHADDADDHGHHPPHAAKPHESPWVVTVPLVLLAVPSVVLGYGLIEPMLYGDWLAGAVVVDAAQHPAMARLAETFLGPVGMAIHGLTTLPFVLLVAGTLAAWWCYLVRPAVPARVAQALRPVVKVLENKYYFDWFNEHVLARCARALGRGLWRGADQGLIETGVVNASWRAIGWLSAQVRQWQSGLLSHYALAMLAGVFALVTVFVWLA
ncbi:MAG: NADH-quinone oxidoreductase subunit L [Proteobacteria bacterium]|nr:NADH-quinone oxidoreductase subunit L [Pseudomonadota bacterium]MDA1328129.1 NADH-quinone oxidoreductase subunit L [Pseudomonadota bacterium]